MLIVLLYFGIGFLVSLATIIHLYIIKWDEDALKLAGFVFCIFFSIFWPVVILVYLSFFITKMTDIIGDNRVYKNINEFILKTYKNIIKLFNFIVFDWFCDRVLLKKK